MLNLDHVVVVVPDLVRAMEQYRSLGFTVSFGGDNGPTHNALIAFEDRRYIELISIRSNVLRGVFKFLYRSKLFYALKPFASHLSFRFFCWMGGATGIRDWCLKQEPLDQLVSALSENHIVTGKIERFVRTKPDLKTVEWFLLAPTELRLPFFIQDIAGCTARIPSGDAVTHSNGYKGISGLLLDQGVYSSVRDELFTLDQKIGALENGSRLRSMQLVDRPGSRISIELVTNSPTKAVLAVHNDQPFVV